MQKLYFLILLFLLSPLYLFATLILDKPNTTGGNIEHSTKIVLKPGFRFQATADKSLTLSINEFARDTATSTIHQAPIALSNKNYILSVTPLDECSEVTIDNTTVKLNKNARALVNVRYFDDLGRPKQQVQVGVTPQNKDLVTWQEYDVHDRASNAWLPAIGNDNNKGAAMSKTDFNSRSTATYNTTTYNTAADISPYSKTMYEESPLNRIVQQFGAGNDWHNKGKAVKTEYFINTADDCVNYSVEGNSVKRDNFYPPGSLYKTQITDEDGKVAYEFKDKSGRVVLQRQMDGTNKHDTYFVFDNFGQLRFVLPPAAADGLSNNGTFQLSNSIALRNYAYYYRYDDRGNCVTKRLPGADSIVYRYDKADRVIFTQDGEMRTKGQWWFSIPDAFGRTVLEGTFTGTPPALPNVVTASLGETTTNFRGYTITGVDLPTANRVVLNSYYYDNYLFRNVSGDNSPDYNYNSSQLKFDNARWGTDNDLTSCKGLLTGKITRELDAPNVLTTVFYYDKKGRMIQSISENHQGNFEKEYINYSFTGQPTRRQSVVSSYYGTIRQTYRYGYDHAGRKKQTKYQIDNTPEVTLSELVYDELGRVAQKKLLNEGQGFSQTINYKYNIRNWLKSISAPAFKQDLYYNDPINGATACYNDNISSLSWNMFFYNSTQSYAFTYDGLNRLRKSIYSPYGLFNEEVGYDKMGNITSLQRNGSSAYNYDPTRIDNLTLNYDGNQLQAVTESAIGIYGFVQQPFTTTYDYAYNKNGALQHDNHGGISFIRYNLLNLPEKITFRKGHVNQYKYDAMGQKRQVTHVTVRNDMAVPLGNAGYNFDWGNVQRELVTDYFANGSIIYEDYGNLKMIRTEEGFLKRSGSGYIHYIYIKDHLGNNRAVIRPDGWGGWNQYQEMSYYPFGMPHGLSDYSAELQPFKFGDKELDEMHGLKRSDHHARQLSSVLGIWDQFDPLSEARPNESPYSAFGNNPVNKIDPTGLIWEDKRDMRRLLKATEDQITSLKGAIKDGGLSDEELADHEGRIKHLEQSQRDVHRLESDEDNLYSLRTISDSEAHFVRQGEGNRVVIEEHSSIGTALHEVGHIRQSLNAGELKFKDGKLLNAGKTPRTISRNEVEAYQIQYSFNPSLIPDGLKHLGGLRGIDYHSVGNLKHNGKSLYPRVKDYSEYLKNKLLR